MDQTPKHKSENSKTLRRKHGGKASRHWIYQWICMIDDTKSTGNKSRNRSVSLHQTPKVTTEWKGNL